MAERPRIIRPNGECAELKLLLGPHLPRRSFIEQFRPSPGMYLRPEAAGSIHGDGHSARVNVWAQVLAAIHNQRGAEVDPVALGWFAMTHDLQRADDNHDPDHGIRAASRLHDMFGLSGKLLDVVGYLDIWHVPHDWLAPALTPELLLVKEADTVERLREKGAFDPAFLRFDESESVLVAPAQMLVLLSTQIHEDTGLSQFDSAMQAAVEMGILMDS